MDSKSSDVQREKVYVEKVINTHFTELFDFLTRQSSNESYFPWISNRYGRTLDSISSTSLIAFDYEIKIESSMKHKLQYTGDDERELYLDDGIIYIFLKLVCASYSEISLVLDPQASVSITKNSEPGEKIIKKFQEKCKKFFDLIRRDNRILDMNEYILVPIHRQNHWVLFVVELSYENNSIRYGVHFFDSMNGRPREQEITFLKRLLGLDIETYNKYPASDDTGFMCGDFICFSAYNFIFKSQVQFNSANWKESRIAIFDAIIGSPFTKELTSN